MRRTAHKKRIARSSRKSEAVIAPRDEPIASSSTSSAENRGCLERPTRHAARRATFLDDLTGTQLLLSVVSRVLELTADEIWRELTWNVGQVNRERELQDLERDIPKNEQTKAELNQAKTERDRLLADEAKAKKELELTRKAEAEAATALQTALQQTRAAVAEKKAAETRASELATQEANLKTEVARFQAQQEQLAKTLADDKAAAAKLTVDLTAERKQLADVEKQVAAARTQVSELQASVTKNNNDLQASIAEQHKALRNRETLLADVTAADFRFSPNS